MHASLVRGEMNESSSEGKRACKAIAEKSWAYKCNTVAFLFADAALTVLNRFNWVCRKTLAHSTQLFTIWSWCSRSATTFNFIEHWTMHSVSHEFPNHFIFYGWIFPLSPARVHHFIITFFHYFFMGFHFENLFFWKFNVWFKCSAMKFGLASFYLWCNNSVSHSCTTFYDCFFFQIKNKQHNHTFISSVYGMKVHNKLRDAKKYNREHSWHKIKWCKFMALIFMKFLLSIVQIRWMNWVIIFDILCMRMFSAR